MKENKTKLKKETVSDDLTLENRENKDKPEQPTEAKKSIKKKIRQSRKIKNILRDFKIYYQYIRGLKSKTDSLDETTNNMSQHKYV